MSIGIIFFVIFFVLSFGFYFVNILNFYQCLDNDYRMECDWSFGVLYSGCVVFIIREIVF